jgi:hypothetical protein
MTSPLTETEGQCPFCGETITLFVDCSEDEQDYIEDCTVCCRPIRFLATCQEGELLSLRISRD